MLFILSFPKCMTLGESFVPVSNCHFFVQIVNIVHHWGCFCLKMFPLATSYTGLTDQHLKKYIGCCVKDPNT